MRIAKLILIAITTVVVSYPSFCEGSMTEEDDVRHVRVEFSKATVLKTERPVTRVSIANTQIADVTLITPTQIMITSTKEPGSTSLILWHGDHDATVYEINVYISNFAKDGIEAKIKELAPDTNVKVSTGGDGIFLAGTVESLESLQRVVQIAEGFVPNITNLMVVRGCHQVQIEVTIAEVSRSAMKRMGLAFLNNKDWKVGLFPNGSATGTLATSQGTDTGTSIDAIRKSLIDSEAEIASPFGSAFQVLLHSVNDDSLAILSLLKGQGLARTLAKPNLVTMSGQEAEFLVGGEFPVPMSGEDGTTNVDYREYGVRLRFTPTVIGKETITLRVEPEVSGPDFVLGTMSGGVAVPALTTRRSSTTLQLKDGQTFIMAGLLKEEMTGIVNRVPLLGQIPILGTLFTSKEYQRNETELVIVVTPRLVRALNASEVPRLPGEQIDTRVGSAEFFLLNRTASDKNAAEKQLEQRPPVFVGDTGFAK